MVNPGPRDFTNCQFHEQRTDGELFCVIKNGSPDTDMVSMIPTPIKEEEAWKILLVCTNLLRHLAERGIGR
jgi:hypothetical protein